jgi:hypothetical protein
VQRLTRTTVLLQEERGRATFTYYGEAYNAPMFDSNTDIASVWTQAEFNIVGNLWL